MWSTASHDLRLLPPARATHDFASSIVLTRLVHVPRPTFLTLGRIHPHATPGVGPPPPPCRFRVETSEHEGAFFVCNTHLASHFDAYANKRVAELKVDTLSFA